MDNVTLSQRFANIGIVDNEHEGDSDLIAMRKKYFPQRNSSTFSLSCGRTCPLTADVNKVHEDLEMDSDWKIHYKKLKQKCESLVSGVCFSIYEGACMDDDFLLANGKRSDHEHVVDSVGDSLEVKESLQNESSAGDLNLTKNDPETYKAFSWKDRNCSDFRESDHTDTCDYKQSENARKESDDQLVFGAGISSEADIETVSGSQTVSRKVTSHSVNKNTVNLGSMNVSNKEDSNRNKATKIKIVTKRKDPKVVRKFDIKPSSSFPLDELLPIVEKSPKKICSADEEKIDKGIPEKINTNSDSFPHQELNLTETEVFHGSVFDYSYSSENNDDDTEPVINTNNINTGLSYINTGIIPDCSDVLSHTMTETVKSQQYDYNDHICPETNKYAKLESPLHTSTLRSINHFNMSTVSSDILNDSSMDFYKERNSVIQNTLDEIGRCQSMEQCENLLMTLNDQCSVLASNDKDRLKLQSMIDALRSKVIDACLAVQSVSTDLTPSKLMQDNVVGPGGDSVRLAKNHDELFEGRTLLKGGVEPRHIPKTSIDKRQKDRPVDPRLSHSDNHRKHPITLPLPKFSVDLYGEKTVKWMTHLDWDVYLANKHKCLKVKDPKVLSNTNHGTSDVETNTVNGVSPPAIDSMKCALDTGNVKISVQQSFLDSNSSLNFGTESNMWSKLSGVNVVSDFCNHGKIMSSYVSDCSHHGVNTSSNVNVKHKKSSQKSGGLVNAKININEQPVDMNVDDDLEDGQILTDGSLSDVSSIRNVGSDAVDMDCKTSDVKMMITIPGNGCEFRENVRSSTREYRQRQRSSSKSSVASSTSRDTKSISSQSLKGSESNKHDSHSDSSKRKHHHCEQSKNTSNLYESPRLSVERKNQASRRRHQTARDAGFQHNIQSDMTQTMKRHHSLEEVVRKRHKSGDILKDNVYNEASFGYSDTLNKHHNDDIELTDSSYPMDTTIEQNYNQPCVHDASNQLSIHDRLGWKSTNQSLQSIPKTVPEQLSNQNKHFQTGLTKAYGYLGQENMRKVVSSGHHKVYDRLGQLYIHEQSGKRSIKRQEVKPIKHHHESYGPYHTSKTSSTIVDEGISQEYDKKYGISKINSNSLNPLGKNSGVKRRKSLEEQEKEMEKDKKFLDEFKMKIIGKK